MGKAILSKTKLPTMTLLSTLLAVASVLLAVFLLQRVHAQAGTGTTSSAGSCTRHPSATGSGRRASEPPFEVPRGAGWGLLPCLCNALTAQSMVAAERRTGEALAAQTATPDKEAPN